MSFFRAGKMNSNLRSTSFTAIFPLITCSLYKHSDSFQRNFKADGYKQVEITSKILGGQVDQSSRQVARVSFFSKDFHNRRCVYRILEAILHLRRFLSLTINSKLCKVREKGRRGGVGGRETCKSRTGPR